MNLRNIESAKLTHCKSVNERNAWIRQNDTSYYKIHRNYNKYFAYNPKLIDGRRSKTPLMNERWSTAAQREPKMSKKEHKLNEESIKAIKMIKQKLRQKQALTHNKNENKDKEISTKKAIMDFRRQSLQSFLNAKSIFDKG